MSKTLVRAGVCVLSVVAAGCGSSGSSTTAAESTAAPSVHPVSGPRLFARRPTTAPTPAQAVEEADLGPDTTTKHGVVEADNINYSGESPYGYSTAQLSGNGILTYLGPKISSAGGCTLYKELTTNAGANAGDITVSTTTQSLTLDPSGSTARVTYSSESASTYPFAKGIVDFSAAGGAGLGAFSGSVKAPAPLAGFTPPATITRTKDLDLTWTAESGDIAVYVIASSTTDAGSASSVILRCTTTDTGAHTIFKSALALLPVTSEAAIALVRYAQKKVPVGDYSITVVVNQVSEGPTTVE